MNDIKLSNSEKISLKLYNDINNKYPVLVDKVFKARYCDIDPTFLGFVDKYYHLSKIIPKHFTILDLGCAYAFQAWYFRNHKEYIGVDINCTGEPILKLPLDNMEYHINDIETEIKFWDINKTKEVFAICNYVPLKQEVQQELKSKFANLFIFYPSGYYDIKNKRIKSKVGDFK
jgi:hypothetical protein